MTRKKRVRRERWIIQCVVCGVLHESKARHTKTCGAACRQRLRRRRRDGLPIPYEFRPEPRFIPYRSLLAVVNP
jgi:hypothetical protein